MKKRVLLSLTLTVLILGAYILLKKNNSTPNGPSAPTAESPVPSTASSGTAATSNLPSPANSPGSSEAPAPEAAKAPNSATVDPRVEQFKKSTLETTAKLEKQMRQDEIASLKASIVNDKKLLKALESQGSGAADYQYIEANLNKRKKRLQQLLK